ncbi:MAG: hypothetical protein ASARMPREDX12_002546 [Alectoria sarmentosa]|nr:MAG: hypothetical protein ASARMPREDX12_002546 [Alectoria sarmentosa]
MAFSLGMGQLKDYSGNPAARQNIQSPSLAAGLASWLEDTLSATGRPINLKHEDFERGIKEYLNDNYNGIEKDAAYGRKVMEKERIPRPHSHFEEAVQQVKRDAERMKQELDLGLDKVLEFRDKIPKEIGEE